MQSKSFYMKYLIVFMALVCSNLAFSITYEPQKTKCLNMAGGNKIEACTITFFGNTYVNRVTLEMNGGQVVILELHPYDPERTYVVVGKDEETAVPGKEYPLDAKTKKIVANYKDDDWYCAKQIKGEIYVCYIWK